MEWKTRGRSEILEHVTGRQIPSRETHRKLFCQPSLHNNTTIKTQFHRQASASNHKFYHTINKEA